MRAEECAAVPKWKRFHSICRVMGVVAILCFASTVCDSANKPNLDGFAQCLAAKKATMYGSFLCPHCDDQKRMFGRSFKYVPYVECSIPGSRQMTFDCQVEMIRHTPTWILASEERLIGVQSLETLSEKTGCPLK